MIPCLLPWTKPFQDMTLLLKARTYSFGGKVTISFKNLTTEKEKESKYLRIVSPECVPD